MFLCRICRKKTGRCDSIDPQGNLSKEEFPNSFIRIRGIKFLRCLFLNDVKQKVESHAFSDPSEVGYGAGVCGR